MEICNQKSSFTLTVEYFALGEQYHDDKKFILLDRRSDLFTPTKENQFSHQFHGDPVEIMNYELLAQRSGNKYKGHLLVVTDERGVIIQPRGPVRSCSAILKI